MAVVTPTPKTQFLKADGTPLVGGKVYTYVAGTTTPLATYTDYSATSVNTNPVILNSRGEANIWLGSDTYKFRLTDATDVEIWTVDYISAPTTSSSPALSGNVTISSNSINPALKITQVGTGNVLTLQDSADPDATPFVVTSTGSVGIGTNAPVNKLDVNGVVSTDTIVEYTVGIGVTVAGVILNDSAISGDYLRVSGLTAVSASGTTISFAGIPDWARRITLMFSGVSTDSTSPLLVRIGPPGGITTSGYVSTGARISAAAVAVDSSTTGFIINSTAATDVISGSMTINLLDPVTFLYSADHTVKASTTTILSGGGNISLAQLMTRLSITTVSGTANFDAGTINLLYQ